MSGTDSLFLAGETPNWHQHIAGLVVLDPTGIPGFGIDHVEALLAERLPLVPKLTWKLKTVPLDLDRAVWVDDPDFDVRHHLHHVRVDPPGGPREAAAAVAPILGRQLDRTRPLWEMWFLDGLANGRAALLTKLHHSLLDGGGGSVLATLLFDLEASPGAPRPQPPARIATDAPDDLHLLARSLVSVLGLPFRSLRYVTRMTQRAVDLVGHLVTGRARPDLGTMLGAPRTSFNAPIGPRRALAFGSVALADVKAVAKHYEVTVNDVALGMCAGAIRGYLRDAGELPDRELTAGAPVSLRRPGDESLDNQLSYLVLPLGTQFADPGERLRHISRQSRAAKEVHRTLRAHPVGSIAETAPPFVIGSLMRLAYETHILSYIPGMMNTIVSNVPGPPVDLFLAGAKLSGIYSASVLLDCMGLNFTLFSFGDRVDFGLHVDPDLVADPWALADALPAELAALMDQAGLGRPHPVVDPFGPRVDEAAAAEARPA